MSFIILINIGVNILKKYLGKTQHKLNINLHQ